MSSPEIRNTLEEERLRAVYARRQKRSLYTFFNSAHAFRVQDQARQMLLLFNRNAVHSLEKLRILDIGCGNGYWIRELLQWGAAPENLVGIDLLPDRIEEARLITMPGVRFYCGNATSVDFPNGHFDIVMQSTVFTSVLDYGVRQELAREMDRLTKPDGFMIWYDYYVNNPSNPDVRRVGKGEIRRLFPNSRLELRRITLLPPLARVIAPRSWLLCCILSRIPILCTHYFGSIHKEKAT